MTLSSLEDVAEKPCAVGWSLLVLVSDVVVVLSCSTDVLDVRGPMEVPGSKLVVPTPEGVALVDATSAEDVVDACNVLVEAVCGSVTVAYAVGDSLPVASEVRASVVVVSGAFAEVVLDEVISIGVVISLVVEVFTVPGNSIAVDACDVVEVSLVADVVESVRVIVVVSEDKVAVEV